MNIPIKAGSDSVWQRLHQEVVGMMESEAMLASYLYQTVLNHDSLEASLSFLLAAKLATPYLLAMSLRDVIAQAFAADPGIGEAIRRDLSAVLERDPAAQGLAQPFLHYKGFHALESYRVAHWLWNNNRKPMAFFLQNRISEVFAVDIHPAARMGKGILIDHGTSVVIGETAVVGDDVSMLHEVTLGGTGKESGDRHPKVGHGVLIGAGAKVLGNVKIGDCSKIASGSVVLHEVPPHATVAGVPAKIVGRPSAEEPALQMDQQLDKDFGM
ncbi:serine O-acetyltransferase [Geomonas sp.]|uniref:serine O-acetyltransferase n=1 Tax=Geomonas sp. TaxID=2651584 RepID=UPI002B48441E|nr:serine O-acetyltransferase [Geomonas sp.]HJV36313.1 serine O-acetyltransferase [Geomonas sp.]